MQADNLVLIAVATLGIASLIAGVIGTVPTPWGEIGVKNKLLRLLSGTISVPMVALAGALLFMPESVHYLIMAPEREGENIGGGTERGHVAASTWASCEKRCAADAMCGAWTFQPSYGHGANAAPACFHWEACPDGLPKYEAGPDYSGFYSGSRRSWAKPICE